MGLRAKFNLAFVAAFAIGFALAGHALHTLLVRNERDQVIENARIMMSAAAAVRHFTYSQVAPHVTETNSTTFNPASVPSFVAQATFKDVQAQFPDFSYREPTLNPTNLADRPADWERIRSTISAIIQV